MEKWLIQAENLKKIASESDLFAKKVIAKEIFGSNLSLTQKNVVVGYPENVVVENGENVVGGFGFDRKNVVVTTENVVSGLKNVDQNVVVDGYKQQWAALYAARQMVSKKPLCIVMVDVGGIEPPTSRM